jgi:hypothetical protein
MGLQTNRNKSLQEQRERQRARAKRAALRALQKARAAADENNAQLSSWESEFLGSVEERIETYGRAFGDPEKGSPGASLSNRQTGKLKEISAKARGKALKRSGLRRSSTT